MCTKGTPARVRVACHCSHVAAATVVAVAGLMGWWVWAHRVAVMVAAAVVLAAGAAFAYVLMRLSRRVAHHAVLVYRPDEVEAQEAAQAPLPDVVGAAEQITRLAAPAPHES